MEVIELKNKIIFELLEQGLVTIGEKINYEKFLQLYSRYDYLPEFYFAKILDISYGDLNCNLKTQKFKSRILTNFDYKVFKQYCLNYLETNNLVCENQKINYTDFKKLLSHFPFINENIFAEFLKIKISRLQNMRNYPTVTTRIFKSEFKLTDEEKKIVNSLWEEGLIYPGKLINYSDFLELHKLYPQINDYRFAYMLEITTSTFANMKSQLISGYVLKSKINDFILKEKQEIIYDLILNKNAYAGEKINYSRFCELYKGYEYINETIFAEIILNIKYNNFKSLKTKHSNAIIFKNVTNLTDKQKEYIYNYLVKEFNLEDGSKITYEVFLNMFNIVSNIITEKELAEILGINEYGYYSIKYDQKPARIKNGIVLQKMYFLRSLFNESRFYSIDELNKICVDYEITIENIITCFINKYRDFTPDDYIDALKAKNGLFIGNFRMSKTFFDENYSLLLSKAKQISFIIRRKSIIKNETEDLTQEILTYFYEKCGDLELNYGNSEQFYIKTVCRAKKRFLGDFYDKFHKQKSIYYYIDILKDEDEEHDELLTDKTINYENEILEGISTNKYYEYLVKLVQQGNSVNESIEYIAKKLNIDYDIVYQEVKKECELVLSLKKDN